MKSLSVAERPRGLAASRSKRGGALKIFVLTNLHVVENRDQRLPFLEMKVMSCFILVFKPMLLNLATSVNRSLLISGFFIYFWSEI